MEMNQEQLTKFQAAVKLESERRSREARRDRLVDIAAVIAGGLVANPSWGNIAGMISNDQEQDDVTRATALGAADLALAIEMEIDKRLIEKAKRDLETISRGYADAKPAP